MILNPECRLLMYYRKKIIQGLMPSDRKACETFSNSLRSPFHTGFLWACNPFFWTSCPSSNAYTCIGRWWKASLLKIWTGPSALRMQWQALNEVKQRTSSNPNRFHVIQQCFQSPLLKNLSCTIKSQIVQYRTRPIDPIGSGYLIQIPTYTDDSGPQSKVHSHCSYSQF